MPTIADILAPLEQIAPPHLQESYDNAGLITGLPDTQATGALLCLDSTEAVIDEAIAKNCNLVIAHHPIVFRGLKRLNGYTYVERTVIKAIRNDIAVYAIHTNLDNVLRSGVNDRIARKLGLRDAAILQPKPDAEETGAGLIGRLPEPMPEAGFLHHLKSNLPTACIRHTAFPGKPVSSVALCGGSGSFLLQRAIDAGADAFVSADFKYHEFFDADGKILVADIGHYESEQFTVELFFDIIREKFPNFALHFTNVLTNPVHYWV